MSLLMYKIVFSKEIKNFNSVAGICNRLSSEDMFRAFKRQNKHFDFSEVFLFLSDAMPYIDEQYYIPRPAVIMRGLKTLDITSQKALRTISHIEITEVENYFSGTYDYLGATKNRFGSFRKTDAGTFFDFVRDAGLYIISDCDSPVVSNLFKPFLRQFILDQIAASVNICEQPADDSIFNMKINEKTGCRISLSTLSSEVSEYTLREVCADASYIITEKQLDGDMCKFCYLKPGAVISDRGIQIYNENHQPCCISIGFQEG